MKNNLTCVLEGKAVWEYGEAQEGLLVLIFVYCLDGKNEEEACIVLYNVLPLISHSFF